MILRSSGFDLDSLLDILPASVGLLQAGSPSIPRFISDLGPWMQAPFQIFDQSDHCCFLIGWLVIILSCFHDVTGLYNLFNLSSEEDGSF